MSLDVVDLIVKEFFFFFIIIKENILYIIYMTVENIYILYSS